MAPNCFMYKSMLIINAFSFHYLEKPTQFRLVCVVIKTGILILVVILPTFYRPTLQSSSAKEPDMLCVQSLRLIVLKSHMLWFNGRKNQETQRWIKTENGMRIICPCVLNKVFHDNRYLTRSRCVQRQKHCVYNNQGEHAAPNSFTSGRGRSWQSTTSYLL